MKIKVGVITDQTGALSFLGIANANVEKMSSGHWTMRRSPRGPVVRLQWCPVSTTFG